MDTGDAPIEAPDETALDLPNIIWITLDACRAENFSYAGYDRNTSPNIDRLATRGTAFLNHFTQGLSTPPSVPSYMTGRYFPVGALKSQAVYPDRARPEGEVLFPELLSAHGYRTVGFTAHGMMPPGTAIADAFEEYHALYSEDISRKPYVDFEGLNAHVLPWIENAGDQPYFLYIHSVDTHFPHNLDEPYDRWAREIRPSSKFHRSEPVKHFGNAFDEEEQALLRALHDGSINYVDDHIGRLLDTLEKQGLLEDTLVLITSDHGDALGEDGKTWGHRTSHDEIMRVPFVIAGPGVPADRKVEIQTENVDIVPTLLELIGLSPKISTDGMSLVPVMLDPAAAEIRDYTFARYYTYDYDAPQGFVLRTPQFKYEFYAPTGEEHLWAVPDTVADRKDLLDAEPEAADSLRRSLHEDILPLWESYQAIETATIDIPLTKELINWNRTNHGIVRFEEGAEPSLESRSDGKWLFQDGKLWASGWAESVPPLHLRMRVPPGTYSLQVYTLAATDYQGHPATSLLIMAENDSRRVRITHPPVLVPQTGFAYRNVGDYTIVDGDFDIVIANDEPMFWSTVCGFRFVPTGDSASRAASAGSQESIEALGYVH